MNITETVSLSDPDHALFSSITEEKTADITKDLKSWYEEINPSANKTAKIGQLHLTIKFMGQYVSQQGTWADREQKAKFIVDVKNGFKVVKATPLDFSCGYSSKSEKVPHKLVIGKIKVKARSHDQNRAKTFIYHSRHHTAVDSMAQHAAPQLDWNS